MISLFCFNELSQFENTWPSILRNLIFHLFCFFYSVILESYCSDGRPLGLTSNILNISILFLATWASFLFYIFWFYISRGGQYSKSLIISLFLSSIYLKFTRYIYQEIRKREKQATETDLQESQILKL